MFWEIASARMVNIFRCSVNIVYTLSKLRANIVKRIGFMKQKFSGYGPIRSKSRNCANVHFSFLQTVLYLTKEYEDHLALITEVL
jgi:hypothetical protein